MLERSPKILIIVPAFNEEGNVGRTIARIRGSAIACDILVVDDGSKDHTASEAKAAGAQVVSLPFNLGIGGAVQTGFRFANERQYDVAVQIDGDGQHDPAYLPSLLSPILEGRAELTVGSRFLEGSTGFKSSAGRRLGIGFFVHLINALTGVRINDPTSGFRAYGRRLINAFARQYPHDFPEPEAVVAARRMNALILEVPVMMHPRAAGVSSIGHLKSLYYMVKVTAAILLQMITRPITIDVGDSA